MPFFSNTIYINHFLNQSLSQEIMSKIKTKYPAKRISLKDAKKRQNIKNSVKTIYSLFLYCAVKLC